MLDLRAGSEGRQDWTYSIDVDFSCLDMTFVPPVVYASPRYGGVVVVVVVVVVVSETEGGGDFSELEFRTRLEYLQNLDSDRGSYGGARLLSRLSLGPQKVPTDVPCTATALLLQSAIHVHYTSRVQL